MITAQELKETFAAFTRKELDTIPSSLPALLHEVFLALDWHEKELLYYKSIVAHADDQIRQAYTILKEYLEE